jgi:hypothetical protein
VNPLCHGPHIQYSAVVRSGAAGVRVCPRQREYQEEGGIVKHLLRVMITNQSPARKQPLAVAFTTSAAVLGRSLFGSNLAIPWQTLKRQLSVPSRPPGNRVDGSFRPDTGPSDVPGYQTRLTVLRRPPCQSGSMDLLRSMAATNTG